MPSVLPMRKPPARIDELPGGPEAQLARLQALDLVDQPLVARGLPGRLAPSRVDHVAFHRSWRAMCAPCQFPRAGCAATRRWSFRVLSWTRTHPMVSSCEAMPYMSV
eukprot:7837836-Alexandrium_andersonii.AAC.1